MAQFRPMQSPLVSYTKKTRMKTLQETAPQETAAPDKNNVKIAQAPQGKASQVIATETVETLKARIAEMETKIEHLGILQIGKMRIKVDDANKHLHSASCKAGNLSKVALANGIGRVAKDMSGGGTLIPTVSSLADMRAKGLLGETDSKDGKAIVQLTVDQVKALNMIVDGFATLGLCKRS